MVDVELNIFIDLRKGENETDFIFEEIYTGYLIFF